MTTKSKFVTGGIVFIFCLLFFDLKAQIFSNDQPLIIPDKGIINYPVNVAGIPNMMDTTTFGLQSVSVNITHPKNDQLSLYLQSPNGTTVLLLKKNPGSNYINTKFDGESSVYIDYGQSPFIGNFRSIQDISFLNNSGNPNGTWNLIAVDDSTGAMGKINSAYLDFGDKPAKPLLSSSNLPIVIINTNGVEINNSSKLLSDMKIIYNGEGQWNHVNETNYHYEGKIAIKIRGNSSQRYPKKQYGFDTMNEDGSDDIKVSILGMPKESDWILSAIYQDKTMMRNPLTYKLANQMGSYAVRTNYCEVIINNEYRGVFVFQEKIKRDKNRVNIEKLNTADVSGPEITGGYIFKLDNIDEDEIYWRTKVPDTTGWSRAFVYVYPKKSKDINQQQKNYIENYVDAFEQSLLNENFNDPEEGYRKYIDEFSFIDYFILNEVSNNVDAYRKSAYFYKNRNGKLMAGPIWDYDIAWGNANYFGGDQATGYRYSYKYPSNDYRVPFWWNRMMEDDLWKQNMACRYRDLRTNILSLDNLYRIVDSLHNAINLAQERNFIRWNIMGRYVASNPQPIPPDYTSEVANLKSIIKARLEFLDSDLPVCESLSLLPALYPENIVEGVNYEYYEDESFKVVPDFNKIDPAFKSFAKKFDLSVAKRDSRFALKFEGFVDIPKDGLYTFYTNSDDGSILYIDDFKIVDNDGLHPSREVSGDIGLKAGKHKIIVSYFQQDAGKVLNVQYSGPGIVKQVIPQSQLFRKNTIDLLPSVSPPHIVQGLNFDYYEIESLKKIPEFTEYTPVISGTTENFNIDVGNRQNQVAVHFEGYLDISKDGFYTFYTSSDDGSLLYIDGVLIVNNDGLHPLVEKSGKVGLQAGKHHIIVDYFQAGGGKSLTVSFSGEDLLKTQIPASSLFRDQKEDLWPAVQVSNIESGLYYKYYEVKSYNQLPDFGGLQITKEGAVTEFDISVASRTESFAIQFEGYVDIPADGFYNFYTSSDDGSALFIDNKEIVNNDGLHPMRERSAQVGLQAGKHYIRVNFFQASGGKNLIVSYSGPGLGKKIVSASDLYRIKNEELLPAIVTGELQSGLKYKYTEAPAYEKVPDFSESTIIKEGVVPKFDISISSRSNAFAIEYNGYIDIASDGYYTFFTSSDDGSILMIDDRYIVENDGLHSLRERSGRIGLKSGKHKILVGYFQQGGGKILNVSYSGPSIIKEIIPRSILFMDQQTELKMGKEAYSKAFTPTILQGDQLNVKVYPNPFYNSLNIELKGDPGDFYIDIADAQGRKIISQKGNTKQQHHIEVMNISSLGRGVYYLRVNFNNKFETIVIERK